MIVNRYHLKTPFEVIKTKLGIPQDYKQKCVDELYRLNDSKSDITANSDNVSTIMTSWMIWRESKVFNPLIQKIINFSEKQGLLNTQNDKVIGEGANGKITEANLYNCWGAIYKKDDFAVEHDHRPSTYSFVYYLKSSGNTPLEFPKSEFKLKVTDDDLIIFPGYIPHSVPKHNNDEERLLLAGNFMPSGIEHSDNI